VLLPLLLLLVLLLLLLLLLVLLLLVLLLLVLLLVRRLGSSEGSLKPPFSAHVALKQFHMHVTLPHSSLRVMDSDTSPLLPP
jgi:hypothetical protein